MDRDRCKSRGIGLMILEELRQRFLKQPKLAELRDDYEVVEIPGVETPLQAFEEMF